MRLGPHGRARSQAVVAKVSGRMGRPATGPDEVQPAPRRMPWHGQWAKGEGDTYKVGVVIALIPVGA